jgi:hypothetical protein
MHGVIFAAKKSKSRAWWYMPVNLSTWKAEAGGLRVLDQLWLYSKFQVSLSYIRRLCLKKKNEKKNVRQ